MKAKKFRKLKDGEWSDLVRPQADGTYVHRVKCCDCGLIHLIQERLVKNGMKFRAWRRD